MERAKFLLRRRLLNPGELSYRLECVDLSGNLVGPQSYDERKTQREAAFVPL